MIKKITSGLLVLVLLSETSYAAANYFDGVLDNSLMNVTPGGKIVEKDGAGNVKSTTFYTTSVYFRFGGAGMYPAPILNVSPPQISAGCNGLSIKGMFASLIGLSQLEEQLKNAGASIAWGIVVGLIYSLPGIGAAFRMIDSWSKMIQKLLANACTNSAIITQGLVGDGLKDTSFGKMIGTADTYIADHLMAPETLKGSVFGLDFETDSNMVLKSNKKASVPPEQVSENWKNFIIGALTGASMSTNVLSHALSALPPASAGTFITKAFNKGNFSDINYYDKADFNIKFSGSDSVSAGVTTFSMTSLVAPLTANVSKREDIARTFSQVAIARSISGDVVLSQKDITGTLANLKSISSDTNSTAQKEASSKVMKEALDGSKVLFSYTQEQAQKTNSELSTYLVKYLMYGADAVAVGTNIGVSALSYSIVCLPSNVEDNGKVFVIYARPLENSQDHPWFEVSSTDKGAKDRSHDLIYGLALPSGASQSLSDLESSSKIGLLVPDIINKIKVLQQSPETTRKGRADTLVDYNAYHSVRGALSGLSGGGSFISPINPVFIYKASSGGVIREEKGVSITSDVRKIYVNSVIAANNKTSEFVKNSEDVLNNILPKMDAYELSTLFQEFDKQNTNAAIKVAPEK